MSARGRSLVFWIAGVVILAGAVLTTMRAQRYVYRPVLRENLYLPTGKFVYQMSLGYRQLAADLVWFSAVQYYGDYRKGAQSLAYFEGLMDIVMSLDPHFIFAYIFGAWVMSEDLGDFAAGQEMLRKGMAQNPTSWQIPFEIGFLNFTHDRNYELAGRSLDLASRMPGAPERAKRFAAFVYARAGEKDASLRLWQAYKEYTDDPFLKEMAERYIERIKRGESISDPVSQ